jgi:hypothetical protein
MRFLVSLLGSLMSHGGVLVRSLRMFLALLVIAFAVMFRGSAVSLGRVVMMFGGLMMRVFGHVVLLGTNATYPSQLIKRGP